MPREPIPTWYFAVVVVRRGDHFLLVHECKHGQEWYLPAGRIEFGENFIDAAVRETLEESGIPVRITGVLRIEHTPQPKSARLRVIFIGEPVDDTPPKSIADDESLGAAWVLLEDLDSYPLRGSEVAEIVQYVVDGGPVYPVSILQNEDHPYNA